MDEKRRIHVAIGALLSVVFLTQPAGPPFGGGLAGFLEGIIPLLLWPLVGGWIGAYVRLETARDARRISSAGTRRLPGVLERVRSEQP